MTDEEREAIERAAQVIADELPPLTSDQAAKIHELFRPAQRAA